MKCRLFISLCFIAAGCMRAQDIHFSQFNDHHALVNPALTGATDQYMGIMAYKNQWRKASAAPYKTFGTSFEGKVLGGSWKKAGQLPKKHREQDIGRLGAGLSVYRDKAGDGDMSLTQVNLSVAGFVPTGHWSFISVGIQSSLALKRVDQTTLIFPNQYGVGGYDATLNHNENITLDRQRYFDFAAGAMWSYGYEEKNFATKKTTRGKFGFSAYHVTRPSLGAEKLYMKYVAHGDMLFSIDNSYVALAPSFLFQMQGPSREITAGMQLKYYQKHANTKFTGNVKNSTLNYGLYYRSGSAIIMQFLLEREERWSFGLSYDLNISTLRKANKLRGGPELMVRFTPQEVALYQKNQ